MALEVQARHDAAEALLPWYATGRIDADDRAQVERHLAECADCRAELATERRVAAAMAKLDTPIEDSWGVMAARIAANPPLPPQVARRRDTRALRSPVFTPARLRWIAAAQFAALVVLGVQAIRPSERVEAFRTLSGGGAARQGNVLAMFRPDVREADLRRALNAADARLVDGPTAANAYVLDVPGGALGPQGAALRRDPAITLAEPIEQAPAE